jgi:NAD kinase
MKIHIVGKNPEKIQNLKERLKKFDIKYSEDSPDLVISYGGDGTFLISERQFPGIPKILVRDSDKGNNCHQMDIEEIIEIYLKKGYKLTEIKKLKAVSESEYGMKELIGVNDVVIRNSLPTEAIRFRVKIDGEEINKTFIGDGIVVSTPFGSTKGAYFYSITRKSFDKGIGIAFSNVTEHQDYIIIPEDKEIEVKILRAPAVLVADNNRDFVNLNNGNIVKIKQIGESAKIIRIKNG